MTNNIKHQFTPAQIAKALPPIKPLSLVKRRLIESSAAIEEDGPESIAFQHTVFCQVCLPYQDPGSEVRLWQREQGAVSLRVEAGDAKNPKTGEWVKLGLPFGSKPRLILAHLNAEALRQGSPAVNVGDSLTGFVKRIRKFKGGREVRMFKDQLGRLSASLIRLAYTRDGRGTQIDTKIVAGFDLWFPRDERQRVLWPSIVRLSLDYFESLQKHAVPLDERALGALAHSALALDIYAWLAQRLHRIDPGRPQFVAWVSLKEQFGPGYARMRAFRANFNQTLDAVLTQYRAARVEVGDQGMTLRRSQPPVLKGPMLISRR
jgi:hypothetical protein